MIRGLSILALGLAASGCAPRVGPTPAGVPAESVASLEEAESLRAERRWRESLDAFESLSRRDLRDFGLAWRCARGAIELLDASWGLLRKDERISLAQQAVNHAERAQSIDGNRVEGFYWAAAAYGLLGKAKGLGGKKTVQPIVENGRRAASLDPSYEGGGGHRILGALFLKAPAWPTSVGDPEAARDELLAAVEVAPDRPENHLLLARALDELGEPAASEAARRRFEELAGDAEGWPTFWTDEYAQLSR